MVPQKNSKKQGDAGLGAAIGWFTSCGYHVSIPLTDSQAYDLVVDIEGVLCKVQVKTTTQRAASRVFVTELRTKGGNKSGNGRVKFFEPDEVDYLFILTGDGSNFLIPSDKVKVRGQLSLGVEQEVFLLGQAMAVTPAPSSFLG